MIKQSSIDLVRDTADLTELMGRYTTVKNKQACCPLHNERTPSLHIKNNAFYKCFGCGKSGDAFTLVQEMERKTFYEAVEWIAAFYNISLEYDQQSQQEAEEVRDRRRDMLDVTRKAYGAYAKALLQLPNDAEALQYLAGRDITREEAIERGYGFAPADFKFITTPLINEGKYQPALDCGLISSREGKNNDFFYNRIIIPIHDQNGVVVGMAGRLVPTGDKERDKKYPKYLNPSESLIYSKKKLWYGLWRAQKAIKERGFAYISEGYFDVDGMHAAGIENTIGSCGTAIDILQAKFLKRYTDHVCICYDGDEPGIKKAMDNVDIFLQLDFKVSCIELPDKMDPDEFIRANKIRITPKNNTHAQTNTQAA